MSFERYVGTTKNALLSQTEYVLSDLLASIFLYTVAAGVVNTVGREAVQTITSEYISGIEHSRVITVIDCLHRSGQIVQSGTVLVTPTFEQEAFLTYLTIVFGCALDDVNRCKQ